MYGKICSPSTPPPESANEGDDMSLFLRHLLSSLASCGGKGKAKEVSTSDRHFKTLGDDFCRNGPASAAAESSLPILSSMGLDGYNPTAVKIIKGDSVELDEFEYESEVGEGTEPAEGPCKLTQPRTGLKRSRAAEVHNLSEKRRRSRINEKMKALQNLIPNSNKTDKASMLDEAIEYLKQLQLQVQMLSMRNGLMFLPGTIQTLQMSQMRIGDAPLHMNSMGMGMLPTNVDSDVKAPFGLSNQSTSSHQVISVPNVINVPNTETSLGLDLPPTHQGSFQMATADRELDAENILSQSQSAIKQSTANPSDEHSAHSGKGHFLEACQLPPRNSQDILPKGVLDNDIFLQHLQSLHAGRNLPCDDVKSEALKF
ncbi:hypothetical protein H6P81_020033 [Aristolochia fimbriata]